jgi:hypothetical protein
VRPALPASPSRPETPSIKGWNLDIPHPAGGSTDRWRRWQQPMVLTSVASAKDAAVLAMAAD